MMKTRTDFTRKSTCRVFLTHVVATESLSKRRGYDLVVAVNKLSTYLGRPATLGDLTDRTLERFFDWMHDGPLADLGQFKYQKAVLMLARRAAGQDIIDFPLPLLEKRLPQPDQADLGDDPGRWGLQRYFEDVYAVDRQTSGQPLTAATLKSYRSAVRAFLRFTPRNRAMPHVIDRQQIERFRQWLIDRGMNAKKAGNHASAVAAIVKHARPERFIGSESTLESNGDPTRALAYVFEHHYLPAKTKIASEKTERKYEAVFNVFGRSLGHVATLDDLTDESIGAWMRDLRRKGLAARTVNGYRSKLLALWNWCARKRMVEEFPTIEQAPQPTTLPVAWTRAELSLLIAACDQMPGTITGIPAPDWWRALHFVAWDTGERIGALLALRWGMLDRKSGQLVVPAEFRKGGRKPMLYTLRRDTLTMLRAIDTPERELIFPFPGGHCKFYYHYKRLLRFAGLPYVRYKSAMQKMRRSFATHLEAAGGNATDAFQHSERSIAEESYLDPRLIDRTPANALLFPLLSPGGAA